MAGTILIRGKIGLAISSIDFDYMIERLRGAFMPNESGVYAQVFEPLDEGGMSFISAVDIDAHAYQIFAMAVKRAYEKATLEESFPKHQAAWLDLIRMTESDSRYSPSGTENES